MNARPPTTKTFVRGGKATSERKSLSPPTITYALMCGWVNAISSASGAKLMSAPFLSPPGVRVALHGRMACCVRAAVFGARPVGVGDLGDDLAAFLDGIEDGADVEVFAGGALDPDFDVVEVDENSNVETVLWANADPWLCEIQGLDRQRPEVSGPLFRSGPAESLQGEDAKAFLLHWRAERARPTSEARRNPAFTFARIPKGERLGHRPDDPGELAPLGSSAPCRDRSLRIWRC